MTHYLYKCLIKWCLRRHSNKTQKWIYLNYWKNKKSRKTFVINYKNQQFILKTYNSKQKLIRSRLSTKINVFDLRNKKRIQKKTVTIKQKTAIKTYYGVYKEALARTVNNIWILVNQDLSICITLLHETMVGQTKCPISFYCMNIATTQYTQTLLHNY